VSGSGAHVRSKSSANYAFGPAFGGAAACDLGEISEWHVAVQDTTRCCMAGVCAASAVDALQAQMSSSYDVTTSQPRTWLMYLCDGSMAGGGRSKDNCSEKAAGLSGGHGCSTGTVVMRVDHGARAITWEVPGGTITRTLFASHGEQEGTGAEPYAGDLVPVVLLYTGDAATVRHAALAGGGGQAVPPAEAAAAGAAEGEGAAGAAPAAAGVASAPPLVPAAAAAVAAAVAPSGSSGGGGGDGSSSSSSDDDDER
jgi:hypothetical protein